MSTQAKTCIKTLSLRDRLLLILLVLQLLAWLMGGVAAWHIARSDYENQLNVATHKQIQVISQIMTSKEGVAVRLKQVEQAIALMNAVDDSAPLYYQISTQDGNLLLGTPNMPRPHAKPLTGQTLFYNAAFNGKTHHLLATKIPQGKGADNTPQTVEIILGRNSAVYYENATRLAGNMLFPLAGFALLCLVLAYFWVQRGLDPLHKLVSEIDGVQAGNMHHINIEGAPSEIVSVTHALNHLLDTMNRQVDREKRFIDDAAHQLRTPLAGVISQAELAMNENEPQKLRERIDKIHGAALRSSHLVQQLLSLARSEGNAGRHMGSYDLAALAREVAREWIPKSVVKRIDLGYEGLGNAFVRGDRLLMREAISNLIDNALKYSGENCIVNVSVKRLEKEHRSQVVLEVEDNGPGVDAEQFPEVFKRFWRANHHIAGGCGLGLPLVARVAEQHGGVASAHSADPHGFIVRLTLPEVTQPDALQTLHSSLTSARRGTTTS